MTITPRLLRWGSFITSAIPYTGATAQLCLTNKLCQCAAFSRLSVLERVGMSRFLLRTLRGLVRNRGSSRSRRIPSASQKDFHCESFPTATTRYLSLHLNAWYGTMLG